MLARFKAGAAIAVPDSNNSKTGRVAATYAPIAQSCPSSCAFKDRGCYAQSGPTALHVRRLEEASEGARALDVAKAEAAAIDQLPGTLPLRLHVSGDCRTGAAAEVVGDAVARYILRGGQPAWTYTHAWRDVPREAWGATSVLASCESVEEAVQAMARGYAAAVVVPAHPEDGRAWYSDDVKVIPCVEQTRGINCIDCALCFSDDKLLTRRAVIAFAPHGAGTRRVREIVERGAARAQGM